MQKINTLRYFIIAKNAVLNMIKYIAENAIIKGMTNFNMILIDVGSEGCLAGKLLTIETTATPIPIQKIMKAKMIEYDFIFL
ncbi:hypothetical protein I5421_23845 [Citrobacter braakii]|nr:hypothetical protein [Citrobacter braakii]MBJ8904618.1 hypothetical protein [Citrobacter braakii]MBJ8909271.1 hypothetical protein [Citrobacter braakii]MBJ8923366.1 hypothetical protein [Citrobacter braakii]